jgi:beta-galactosidase
MVQVQVNSKLDTEKSVKIVASLVDPDGNKRSSSSIKAKVDPGISVLAIKLTDIENPKLWSPGAPYLYSVQVTLEAGQIRDELSDRFGYRWYDLEEGVSFNLNGESLTLKAMERYEKRTGLGSALPDSLHRRDLEMIKEKGANIVRLAHHPHDPEVYRACDELGLLVWDEFPWCCGGMGGEYWQSVTERLFKEQISQNYNHPSIIFWSFGGKQDWKSQDLGSSNEELKTYVSYLNSVAHDYDPYRRTSMQRFQDWADRYGITYE